ncbi:hypothetical protein EVAR_41229_1 [Eumeta japonica]|uniref:Uncharacterized protein n=1 Tax=Eumeta variegata TaxID=151549 RepID=A0A4C1W3N2_EUMVA|nr:hypothetical protein EVAR_41229_1 [Eumeta japonica]
MTESLNGLDAVPGDLNSFSRDKVIKKMSNLAFGFHAIARDHYFILQNFRYSASPFADLEYTPRRLPASPRRTKDFAEIACTMRVLEYFLLIGSQTSVTVRELDSFETLNIQLNAGMRTAKYAPDQGPVIDINSGSTVRSDLGPAIPVAVLMPILVLLLHLAMDHVHLERTIQRAHSALRVRLHYFNGRRVISRSCSFSPRWLPTTPDRRPGVIPPMNFEPDQGPPEILLVSAQHSRKLMFVTAAPPALTANTDELLTRPVIAGRNTLPAADNSAQTGGGGY